ncbi:HesA/MoeB/ThiF family protein [Micrococcus sp. ACRRV]|uniref:ThiF family adenylyltransferase n=1 Tax=Micrococcus sp. ACRRV TaxID=2918203 RepID=UPI001EF2CFDF|nr:HesA/MoeB/ThiF family protein [Micrococcus sp. ACRRV]
MSRPAGEPLVPEDRAPHSLDELSDTQLQRFARHLGLAGFGPEAQLRLLRARVLVVGAGGLGAPVLTYLAAAGVGEVHVVDDDVVDRSNLHRQVIHVEADLGRPKTASAAETMRGLHPEIRVVEHRQRLAAANALELVGAVDLVVDGSDNYATRYLVADAGEIAGVPVVWGAILRFAGQVSVFAPGGPLYRDVFPDEPEPGEVPTCAQAGVLGVLPGIIGSLMAAEAVKLLAGVGEPLTGRLLSVDALTMRFSTLRLVPDPERTSVTDLSAHTVPRGGADPVESGEITPAGLAALLADPERAAALTLLDVREDWERGLARISAPAAAEDRHVRLDEVLADPAAHSPESGRTVVVYCAAGARSARAREAVVAAAPEAADRVLSLAGGHAAWADRN